MASAYVPVPAVRSLPNAATFDDYDEDDEEVMEEAEGRGNNRFYTGPGSGANTFTCSDFDYGCLVTTDSVTAHKEHLEWHK